MSETPTARVRPGSWLVWTRRAAHPARPAALAGSARAVRDASGTESAHEKTWPGSDPGRGRFWHGRIVRGSDGRGLEDGAAGASPPPGPGRPLVKETPLFSYIL